MSDVVDCPPPTRKAVVAAYTACVSAIIGFIPLHLVWALGWPLWTYEDRFKDWYDGGGGSYLMVLNGLAVLAGVFALSLVRPWGVVFPRWVPALAGRRVPRRLMVALAAVVSVFLFLYTLWAAYYIAFIGPDVEESKKIFSPWIVAFGIPQFLVWSLSLMAAGWYYYRRTAQPPAQPNSATD